MKGRCSTLTLDLAVDSGARTVVVRAKYEKSATIAAEGSAEQQQKVLFLRYLKNALQMLLAMPLKPRMRLLKLQSLPPTKTSMILIVTLETSPPKQTQPISMLIS